MLLLLTAAAVAIVSSQRERKLRESPALLRNLLPLFREAEVFTTTRVVSLGSLRGRALCVEPDPRRFESATGMLTNPEGDPPYAWFVGRRSGFQLDVLERLDRTLTLRLATALPPEREQRLRLLFNGVELSAVALRRDGELQSVVVDVPAELQKRGPNQVELIFSEVHVRELLIWPTPLPLAAIVPMVTFLAEGESSGPTPPPPRRGLVSEGDVSRAELLIPADTCMRLAQQLPDEERLVLLLGVSRLDAPLLVTLQDDAGRRHQLRALEPRPGEARQLHLDLTPWAGEVVALEFWARGKSGQVVLATAQLRGGDPGALTAPVAPPPRAAAEPRPSFLLVVLDALGRSRVGAYANSSRSVSLTPRLDALAARGLRVDRAQAPASYTLASTASLLTGQAPLTHGVVQLRSESGYQRLDDAAPRLARSLSAAGWRTAALVTNPNAGARHGHGEGFDEYLELDQDPSLWDNGVAGEHLAPRFAELLERAGDEPVFTYVHVFEPHAPYEAPSALSAAHVEPYDGPVRGDREWLDGYKRGEHRPDDAGWRHLRQLYAARVALADQVLGELLDTLAASGRAEDTLVFVTSDHGEAFGEHGWVEHGDLAYGEEIDVPMILAGRGIEVGHVPGPASLIDVAPTLLRLAGVSVPGAMEGADLLAPTDPDRALMARSAALLPVLSLTRWPWRLHVDTRTRRLALHDLERDPAERSNLARRRPATTLLLLQEIARRVLDARIAPAAAQVAARDPEADRMLTALGYVGEEPAEGFEPLEELALVLRALLTRL